MTKYHEAIVYDENDDDVTFYVQSLFQPSAITSVEGSLLSRVTESEQKHILVLPPQTRKLWISASSTERLSILMSTLSCIV